MKKKIYLGGTFDLFHMGHVNLLMKAKQLAEKVVVSLNTDEFNEKYKGKRPIMTLAERIEMLNTCPYVDEVIVNTGGADSKPAILKSGADSILHGSDWTGNSLYHQMGLTETFLKEHKIEIIYQPYTHGISSTDLKKRILKQYFEYDCRKVIVIATHSENRKLCINLLDNLKGYFKYPIIVVLNEAGKADKEYIEELKKYEFELILNVEDSFELGALKIAYERQNYDEIFLLQDSCEIKDVRLFDLIFKEYKDRSVAIGEGYNSYLGKYKREILNKISFPEIKSKEDSIRNEGQFNKEYISKCPVGEPIILFGNFGKTAYKGNYFEKKFGRKNLVIENEYLKKYKGVYNQETLKEYAKDHS